MSSSTASIIARNAAEIAARNAAKRLTALTKAAKEAQEAAAKAAIKASTDVFATAAAKAAADAAERAVKMAADAADIAASTAAQVKKLTGFLDNVTVPTATVKPKPDFISKIKPEVPIPKSSTVDLGAQAQKVLKNTADVPPVQARVAQEVAGNADIAKSAGQKVKPGTPPEVVADDLVQTALKNNTDVVDDAAKTGAPDAKDAKNFFENALETVKKADWKVIGITAGVGVGAYFLTMAILEAKAINNRSFDITSIKQDTNFLGFGKMTAIVTYSPPQIIRGTDKVSISETDCIPIDDVNGQVRATILNSTQIRIPLSKSLDAECTKGTLKVKTSVMTQFGNLTGEVVGQGLNTAGGVAGTTLQSAFENIPILQGMSPIYLVALGIFILLILYKMFFK